MSASFSGIFIMENIYNFIYIKKLRTVRHSKLIFLNTDKSNNELNILGKLLCTIQDITSNFPLRNALSKYLAI